jgi:hyperosmotically inducible periplasmic protein
MSWKNSRTLHRMALSLIAVCALPLSAYANTSPSAGKQSEQSVLRMAQQVERAILRLPQYGLFDEIRFTISDYVVTLKGAASRPALRTSAEQTVRKIEGVVDVVNQIEELPLSRMDEDIRFRVYSAIYLHPWLERFNPNRGSPVFFAPGAIAQGISLDPPIGYHPIHIIVKDGRVKLTGVVATAGDKALAGLVVNNLPNIFAVENDLAIAEEAKPSKPAAKKPGAKA